MKVAAVKATQKRKQKTTKYFMVILFSKIIFLPKNIQVETMKFCSGQPIYKLPIQLFND